MVRNGNAKIKEGANNCSEKRLTGSQDEKSNIPELM